MFPSGAVVEEVVRVPLATVESMQHEVLSLLGNDVGVVTWLQFVQVYCERLGARELVAAGLAEQQATMAIAGALTGVDHVLVDQPSQCCWVSGDGCAVMCGLTAQHHVHTSSCTPHHAVTHPLFFRRVGGALPHAAG